MESSKLLYISDQLSKSLRKLSFSQPVGFVYDPTEYARGLLSLYFDQFGQSPKRVVLVGMNPGPWGMLQTGVPFGDVSVVRDWMGIQGHIGQPKRLHTKRPIDGFASTRSEVSGSRLWGWARDRFGPAEEFFKDFFVVNYCPLAIFDETGKNITPDKLRAEDKVRLFRLCDGAMKSTVELLTPEWVIGIGKFAYDRSVAALEGMDVQIGRITHPSPANPAANKGWAEIVERELAEIGIEFPLNVSG
ncbi:MAG: single-stranded DNA-binding protein [bacterium]|nr:single-stranded DNA-binding protein [bacterium]MDT8367342.1 single-stranded DNA-binding protein [bacterium]